MNKKISRLPATPRCSRGVGRLSVKPHWRRNLFLLDYEKFMAGKIEIPENLKAELPLSKWGKVLGATPIVMTVIATMLAGLASSEMTKAQYDRSLAAQLQSKAGDQWGYAAAKKTRGAIAHNSLDLLAATADVHPLDNTVLPGADAVTSSALVKGQLPVVERAKFGAEIQPALEALGNSASEKDIADRLVKIPSTDLAAALDAAQGAALAFDNATKPITKTADKTSESLMNTGDKSAFASFAAARLRYTAARYDTEAQLNQGIASIYELQIRKANVTAEKHHARSGKFFIGMLAAQAAVIVSTFALAARKKNFLWSIAAAAGVLAVVFSLYVYLYV